MQYFIHQSQLCTPPQCITINIARKWVFFFSLCKWKNCSCSDNTYHLFMTGIFRSVWERNPSVREVCRNFKKGNKYLYQMQCPYWNRLLNHNFSLINANLIKREKKSLRRKYIESALISSFSMANLRQGSYNIAVHCKSKSSTMRNVN